MTTSQISTTFSINLGKLSLISVLFPLFALFFSVIYSIIYDFDRVIQSPESPCPNKTIDYLPSITACFSKFYPQTWVWWMCMAFPIWPRLILPRLFFNFHTSKQFLSSSSLNSKLQSTLAIISYYGDVIDVISLAFISYVVDLKPPEDESTIENKSIILIHAASFGMFVVSSQLYILCTTVLHSSVDFYPNKFKKQCLCVSYIGLCIGATTFFFYKQLHPCQDMLQTYFAVFEYALCAVNLTFHLISALDFGDYEMKFLPEARDPELKKLH